MHKPPLGPRVLVVLDTGSAWSRGVLRGFTDAARVQGWEVLHYHPSVELRWLVRVWQPRVVVLQHSLHRSAADALAASAIVSVNDDSGERGVASVCLDEAAIAKLAAQHLLGRGLRELTTFRFNDGPFALARERGFAAAVRSAGARLVPGWWRDDAVPPASFEDPAAITAWLSGLPRPCGVFACTDSWARVVARYARVAGLRIPEDIALIGVDNDSVECELELPPLSSVAVPWRSVGERAAELVVRALKRAASARERLVVAPVDVIARRSTDVTVIDDAIVARATAWIVERASQRLTLQAVARAASCSRQRLEQRFRAAIGRTVMQEVRRVRVDIAKRLLSTTNLALPQVARQSGFSSAALLSVAFRREMGTPPGAYRRRFRGLDTRDD